jgi:hypothetical protein
VDQTPVVFSGHGIEIAFPEEALIVDALHELVHVIGVAAGFVEEELDRAGILLSAMDGFLFFVPANGFCHFRGGDGEGKADEEDEKQHAEQQESFFSCWPGAVASGRRFH